METTIPDRRLKRTLIERTMHCRIKMEKLWGNLGLGFILAHAYFGDDQWVTATDVAPTLDLSDDTTRRQLDELVAAGRVEVKRVRGRKLYRARGDLAERTFSQLAWIIEG